MTEDLKLIDIIIYVIKLMNLHISGWYLFGVCMIIASYLFS